MVEAWWPLVARISGFLFGAYLIYGQATAPNPPGAQEWVIMAGIGCMGPTVASAVATVIEAARGTSSPSPVPLDPPVTPRLETPGNGEAPR
jgi:hypothetical protein